MGILLFLSLSTVLGHSSSLVFGGDFRSAVVDSNNIYVTDGRGLSVFALKDMLRLADYTIDGYSFDIAARGMNFYVASTRGIALLKLGPDGKLEDSLSWLKKTKITALAISGDTLWFSDTTGYLFGQDLVSGKPIPDTPIEVKTLPVRIVPSGTKIYLAADSAGLFVIDLEAGKPEAIKLNLEGEPSVSDILLRNNLLYLAAGDDGLWVAEPRRSSAHVITKVGTDGQITRLASYRDLIAAASGTNDLSIFSAADPKKPVLVQEEGMHGLGIGLALHDSLAILLTGTGFGKVDLSVKPNALQGIFYKRGGTGYDILAKGDVGILATGESGIRTIGIGGDSLYFQGSFADVTDTRKVYLFGSQVYTITATNLMQVVEVKNPSRPERRTFLQFESMLHGLDTEGEMVLTAEDTRGVGSFWRCPCGPLKEQGRLSIEGRALDIKIAPQTRLAFVSVSTGALDVVSWKDSTNLEVAGTLPLSRDYEKLYLDGDMLFGLDYSGALVLINVSRPTRPKEIAGLELKGTPSSLVRAGDTLFVAAGESGVYVVDISDLSSPQVVETIDIDGARGIAVSGERLLVLTPYAVEAYDLK